jgi:crotonobetainyl-CoA:carnitine CoA-transferase CaiB-like acyl-CoA transferase
LRLADAGARVIKIERAGGETARHYDRAVQGTSAYFVWLNRGKESAVLDIKDPADRAIVERMVSRADVFVQNLAPGASARIGLGSVDLVARYPKLIAVDIVGYSQDSSYRDKRAYDMLIQAESGLCSVTGTPETASKVGVSIADVCTGMTAHAAILEALIERSETGRGRAIEIAMFDTMADLMSVPLLHYEYATKETPRAGLSHASIYPYGTFECQDGVIIAVVQNPVEWKRFCEGVLERPDLVTDPRFADNPSRVANRPALDAVIKPIFAIQPRAEITARLERHQLAWSNVSTVADLSGHPALRRMEVKIPHGVFRSVGSPLRRNLEPRPVPALGAQTESIRSEFAA